MTVDQQAVEAFLRARGAERIPHVGGSLYEHLRRVAAQLCAWDADPDVVSAGLCHACYGTDGFPSALLEVSDRQTLAALIGEQAEALVYLYGSCDRGAVYPQLDAAPAVPFRDRFTGRITTPTDGQLRAFAEITAANELDVVAHDAAIAAKHGAGLFNLFSRARPLLSDVAWAACVEILGSARPAPR